jgi:4-methylaminobutanoate oxidase (formaldehyde-forming)
MAGAAVPVVPIKHQYVVSEPLGGAGRRACPPCAIPTTSSTSAARATACSSAGTSATPRPAGRVAALAEPRTVFEPDLDKFAESWTNARRRVPALRSSGIARWCTARRRSRPDGEFLLGETAVRGFWVAAGFCVHGWRRPGGVGKVMAEWIVDGVPEWDMSTMDIRRFGAHAAVALVGHREGAGRLLALLRHRLPQPGVDGGPAAAALAGLAALSTLDAALGEKAGWERVNWFGWGASSAVDAPRGWAGRNWSPAIAAECLATTTAAGLFDQSSFAKLDVRGAGAAAFLSWMCAGNVDRATRFGDVHPTAQRAGRHRGRPDVTRLADDHFRVVTSTAAAGGTRTGCAGTRRRECPSWTSPAPTAACVCGGPRAREVLAPLTDDPLDFGFMRARSLTVGAVPVLAQRVTFVGEYGWELVRRRRVHADAVGPCCWSSGVAKPAGYRAIDSMRLEKGVPGLGFRHHPGDDARRGWAVVRGAGRQGVPRAARVAGRPRGRRLGRRLCCLGPRRPGKPCASAPNPSGWTACRSAGHLRRRRVPRWVRRSPTATCRPTVDVGTAVEVGVFGGWVPARVHGRAAVRPEERAGPRLNPLARSGD